MDEREWLDRVKNLSSAWRSRCDLVTPVLGKYQLSRLFFEQVWFLIEWDLETLRICTEDTRAWGVFEMHQRPKIEGILRGFWLEECASDQTIEDLVTVHYFNPKDLKIKFNRNLPKIPKILSELSRKDVPFINERAEEFLRIYQSANDFTHMSVVSILSSRVARQDIYSEIRESLYQIGICALRISRISENRDNSRSIENALKETLIKLDSQIQGDLIS